jgi:glycosyltransferase involved in cell wall biosynthesis
MRVIHFSCVAPPQTGGIGAVAFEEVQRLNEKGIQSVLFSPPQLPLRKGEALGKKSSPYEGEVGGVSIGNAAFLNLKPLRSDLQSADVVHLHYPFYGTAGQLARLRQRGIIKKLVLTLHMDATAQGWKGMVFDLHRRFFQKDILDVADALLVSSKDYAEHSSFAPWKDRVIELPFGVDEKMFCPPPATSYQLPATSARRFSLLHVGGMDTAHAFKGVDVLLRAMKELPTHIHATVVGDGDLRAGFEAQATQFGISDRVHFVGKISQEELVRAYQSADLFVFPSTSQAEAFGLAAVEAQACGLPVVASDLPGVRTVVANGETGFLVPISDASALARRVLYLAEHDDVRHAMGERARQRVLEKFTWDRHMDGLINVYQKVCASPS